MSSTRTRHISQRCALALCFKHANSIILNRFDIEDHFPLKNINSKKTTKRDRETFVI